MTTSLVLQCAATWFSWQVCEAYLQLQEYEQVFEWEDSLRELRDSAASDDVKNSLNLGINLCHVK